MPSQRSYTVHWQQCWWVCVTSMLWCYRTCTYKLCVCMYICMCACACVFAASTCVLIGWVASCMHACIHVCLCCVLVMGKCEHVCTCFCLQLKSGYIYTYMPLFLPSVYLLLSPPSLPLHFCFLLCRGCMCCCFTKGSLSTSPSSL